MINVYSNLMSAWPATMAMSPKTEQKYANVFSDMGL
ncbi:Uncharacterised protein [Klebsiella pneumoniae]|nr:Uncharacterised protein [Klebsiella pneumoniae]